jgi:tetratricopeptide (TPR) repeat protein
MTAEPAQRRILFFISAALITTTLVAYEPIRHNGFVSYDDDKYIVNNEQVTSGITRQSLGRAFTQPHYFMWHPLTTLSHTLDWQLFGPNPLGHHLVSLLLHIANVVLLFWILTNITGGIWPSAFVAAVFAVHPVQVESVAWAAERKTVLSGLFWLLTTAVYIRYTRRPVISRYIFLLVVFGLCTMTKPVVVTLPFILLLLDYWPLERFKKVSAGRLIWEKIPILALSIILSVITFIVQRSGGVVQALEKEPINYRIANMFLSYIRYTGKMIWPSRLAAFYPHPRLDFTDTWVVICSAFFILITIISIDIGLRRRYAAVGWLWYVGTLVPVIGLVQSGTQAMADRYMYIPMVGLLITIAWAVKEVAAERPRLRAVASVSATGVLLAGVILTRMQVGYWQNNTTLFEHTLKITKNNLLGESNYGMALLEAGNIDEAIGHFNNVLRLNKNHANAYLNLGIAYSRLGKYEPAIQNWTKALELKPNSVEALNNLAWLLATSDDVSLEDANRAIKYAERACELTENKNPSMTDTLAAAYAAAGRFEEAVKTAVQAVEAAKSRGKEDLANEIQNRIKLYESGQRYRQKQSEDRN